MNVYSMMVVSILGLSLFMNTMKGRGRSRYVYFSCFIMYIIMGCRDAFRIGNDSTTSYRIIFNSMSELDYHQIFSGGEKAYNAGFNAFMKFLHDLTGGDYQIFIMVLSAVIMLSFAHFIQKYSPSPVQSFCWYWGLLYYTFMFSAEKQALAMAILLFAFDAALEKKPIRFLVLTFLAGTVHFPALIFLLAYILVQLELEQGHLLLLGASLAVTYIFRNPLLRMMMDAYGNENDAVSMDGIAFFRNKVVIMIFILVLALILRPARKQNRIYKALLLFMILAINFQTFCGFNNIFERLADYYFYFSVVFIPMIFEFPKEGIHYLERRSELAVKMFVPMAICGLAIMRFLLYVGSGVDNLYPYYFFWS